MWKNAILIGVFQCLWAFVAQAQPPVALSDAHAQISVPAEFSILSKAELERELSETTLAFYRKHDYEFLGAVIPNNSNTEWVMTLLVRESGYVDLDNTEEEAADPENAERFRTMVQGASGAIAKSGLPSPEGVTLVSPISIDTTRSSVQYSTKVRVNGIEYIQHQLMLFGRRSVIAAVAQAREQDMNKLEPQMESILASITFDKGYARGDFNPAIDSKSGLTLRTYLFGHSANNSYLWKLLAAAVGAWAGTVLVLLIIDPVCRRAIIHRRSKLAI